MTHVLHINDNNLLLQKSSDQGEGGDLVVRSQGYAWLKDNDVFFDINSEQSPFSQCRLVPQQINNRYWQQCSEAAISANSSGMRHAADLIWKHLGVLKRKFDLHELALIVPANYREPHLKLLLGVAKANDLSVSAVISKPVLAVQNANFPIGDVYHIDVQLHQTVVSKLTVNSSQVTLNDIEINTELGLHTLYDSLLNALQASFIKSDRVDPLHDASSEQQLFDQLAYLVECSGKDEKVNVNVNLQDKLYHSTVDKHVIRTALDGIVSLISKYSAMSVIVDMNSEFNVSGFLPSLGSNASGHNMLWADSKSPELITLPSTSTHVNDAQGNMIYQTSLFTNKPQKLATTAHKEPTHQLDKEALERGDKNNLQSQPRPAATHLMQWGMVVPISHARVVINNAALSLHYMNDSKPHSNELVSMIKSGDIEIVNSSNRSTLLANDRLMSPIADGVITAVTVLTNALDPDKKEFLATPL